MFSKEKALDYKLFHNNKEIHAKLEYSLTKTQLQASNEILNYVSKGQSVIVNAVCGAGKTELVYNAIEYFLNHNKRVAFAIPRRDVVIEIYARLKRDYPKVQMSCLYGGHTKKVDAQLIVLTTHQLFRYNHYFDLLILDEADAFPYYKNELLESFLNKSCNKVIIYLSATIKDEFMKICKNIVYVNRRFHNYNLPVPEVIFYLPFTKEKTLLKIVDKLKGNPILIFVPTIEIGMKLSKQTYFPFVYSSFKEKQDYIQRFKNKEFKVLITTSILERGITVRGIQVIVYEANHKLFDEASLVQISGRVGRKISDPTGKVYFLATNMSESMKKCIKEIKSKNESEK